MTKLSGYLSVCKPNVSEVCMQLNNVLLSVLSLLLYFVGVSFSILKILDRIITQLVKFFMCFWASCWSFCDLNLMLNKGHRGVFKKASRLNISVINKTIFFLSNVFTLFLIEKTLIMRDQSHLLKGSFWVHMHDDQKLGGSLFSNPPSWFFKQ